VPLDSLSFDALLVGLRGVVHGALSLYTAIEAARSIDLAEEQAATAAGAAANPAKE